MGGVAAEALLEMLLQEKHGQVRGDRVEPAAVHEPRTTVLSDRVDLLVHFRHPLRFACEVAIVRALGRAGFEDGCTVLRIGSHCADERNGLLGHGIE